MNADGSICFVQADHNAILHRPSELPRKPERPRAASPDEAGDLLASFAFHYQRYRADRICSKYPGSMPIGPTPPVIGSPRSTPSVVADDRWPPPEAMPTEPSTSPPHFVDFRRLLTTGDRVIDRGREIAGVFGRDNTLGGRRDCRNRRDGQSGCNSQNFQALHVFIPYVV